MLGDPIQMLMKGSCLVLVNILLCFKPFSDELTDWSVNWLVNLLLDGLVDQIINCYLTRS